MKKVFILLALPFILIAGNLKLINGEIKAHTEVLGDSKINPSSSRVSTKLTIHRKNISSIKGKIYISTKSLTSDNKSRDEHMYKTLNMDKFQTISYTINSIKHIKGNEYQLIGKLYLAGKTKSLNTKANIIEKNSKINLDSSFSIKLTEFGLNPPKMLFLTVRDRVDINVKLALKIR